MIIHAGGRISSGCLVVRRRGHSQREAAGVGDLNRTAAMSNSHREG